MAVTSAEEFHAVLEKSKLLIPSQLAEVRSSTTPDDTPRTIAKRLARQELITRWQAGQLLAGRSSFYLGKYRLIELLGRGGMGSVFLGQHVTMNRRVALKIISREVSQNQASLKRFLADARVIAAIDHPNVLQAYSVDSEGERYYLVMEYVEGTDLQRLVEEKGPLDAELAADYIQQTADGLEYAHQQGMFHHDIRPSKLLVNTQGVVKIIDLGLAWLGRSDPSPPAGEGQPALIAADFLAPEQTLNNVEPDGRADIYSLGCVFYFLLTGHAPFPRGAAAERILKHQTEEVPDISIERPKVPAGLTAICRRMAAIRPEDRYQTAAEASLALAQWRAADASPEISSELPMAEPLGESEEGNSFGIDFDDMFREQHPGNKGRNVVAPESSDMKETGEAPTAMATPMRHSLSRNRVIGVALAVLLGLLGIIIVSVIVTAR